MICVFNNTSFKGAQVLGMIVQVYNEIPIFEIGFKDANLGHKHLGIPLDDPFCCKIYNGTPQYFFATLHWFAKILGA